MLRMQLPTEPIVHVDETGWWNAGTRCYRSDKGIRTFEILASLCATLKSRGMDMLGWLKYRMEGVGPKYIPPELLPEDFGHEIQLC